MSYRPHGKHVQIDPTHPQALGICDFTGFVFNRKNLVRQMEWRGNRLVWTGFYVGRPYVDDPNPQLKPPILPPDPVPVKDPRPPQYFSTTWSQTDSLWAFESSPWNQAGEFELDQPALPEDVRLLLLQQTYWGA